MRTTLCAIGVAALMITGAATPVAAETSATVRVHANTFDPFEVAVDPDGTVTWLVEEDGHTIDADDGRFSFRSPDGGTLAAGTTVSFTVGSTEEYIGYYCTIHGDAGGLGMAGLIKVGEPPKPPPFEAPVIRVPEDEPTIASALDVTTPGHHIEVAPGTYGIIEPVEVDVDDITIAGTGETPADVLLEPAPGPRGFPSTALRVTASGVHIENLTVRGFRASGISFDGAERSETRDVVVDGEAFSLDGITAAGVSGVTLRRTTTTGARRAGIWVSDCSSCGVLVDDARSEGNLVGVLVEAGPGVIVRDSTVTGNAAGVVAGEEPTLEILDSTITGNTDRTMVASARTEDRLLAVGAGVWLSGPAFATVRSNDITGNGYGIAVAGGAAHHTTITDNQLADNADADLGWDGLGANVCFADNGAATSDPPSIETLYPCDRPTSGVPYPVVETRLLQRALG